MRRFHRRYVPLVPDLIIDLMRNYDDLVDNVQGPSIMPEGSNRVLGWITVCAIQHAVEFLIPSQLSDDASSPARSALLKLRALAPGKCGAGGSGSVVKSTRTTLLSRAIT